MINVQMICHLQRLGNIPVHACTSVYNHSEPELSVQKSNTNATQHDHQQDNMSGSMLSQGLHILGPSLK